MGSVRRRGGAVRIDLDPPEAMVLAGLVEQVRRLLSDGIPEGSADDDVDPLEAFVSMRLSNPSAPEDPVLARLLPAAYRDDEEAASEYRRLMDADLRLQKCGALRRVLDGLAGAEARRDGNRRIELTDDDAAQWLYALTDVRLMVGTTLGVSEDLDAELAARSADTERAAGLAVYDWLTWLQDRLVHAVSA